MADLQRQPPLAALGKTSFITAGLQIVELPCVTKMRVQALRARGLSAHVAGPQFLPVKPNSTIGEDPCLMWKAPDDWLAYSLNQSSAELAAYLGTIVSAAPLVQTDVSSATTMLELSGPRILELLARDCTLDLEGGAIGHGECAQTVIAQVPVMFHRPINGERWRLFVDRSLTDYLRDWLIDSAGPAD